MSEGNLPPQGQPQVIITMSPKSMGISLLLTAIFGALGLFYSTIIGAIVMIVVEFVVGILTFGLGIIIIHPLCMIIGAIAVHMYNQKLMSGRSM